MPTRWVNWLAAATGVVLWLGAAEATPQGSADPPDADFLEFLGSWTSGDNQSRWIDPFQIEDPVPVDSEHSQEPKSQSRSNDAPRSKPSDSSNKASPPNPVRPGGGVKP